MPKKSKPLLVVDAWNVIRSRWPNFEPNQFVELVERWAAENGVEPLVVFDGEAPEAATTVGTGGESADDWIARHAPRWNTLGRRLWFVTSDRELRGRISRYAERLIGGGSFGKELG